MFMWNPKRLKKYKAVIQQEDKNKMEITVATEDMRFQYKSGCSLYDVPSDTHTERQDTVSRT